ncbi:MULTISPECIES: hypothetical protein [Flavobacterium]|uniref:hypothetical protein n=1 Tax=Flavobacterium TaxID=237 RepID=UPI001183B63F|nr:MULTISPECIES: hypothetical protein [Flavobacterium]MCR4033506.1 hypothetical protein [Flavobacterium panacis]
MIGILAGSKIFESKPYLFPLVILVTLTITFLALRQIGTEKINTNILLSIHVLRIPVELVLFELFLQDKIPYLMTFKGWNFDIINGISALAILIYQIISRRKIKNQFFFLWNISGILFLIFIVSLAILSSPLPIQQFAFEQPNIAVLEFPYCFLPTCIVPIVLMSHILFLKSLNTKFIQK